MPRVSLTDMVLVAVLLGAVLVSAACAASETAVFSLTHTERGRLRRSSPAVGRAIDGLLSRPRSFLLSVLLLTNIANVLYFVVGWMLEGRLRNHALGVVLNIALVLLLIVAADLLPKLLA